MARSWNQLELQFIASDYRLRLRFTIANETKAAANKPQLGSGIVARTTLSMEKNSPDDVGFSRPKITELKLCSEITPKNPVPPRVKKSSRL